MVRKESIIAGFLFHPQGKCDSGEKNWKLLPDFLRAHQPGALSCCPASGPDGERQLSCSEVWPCGVHRSRAKCLLLDLSFGTTQPQVSRRKKEKL